MTKKELTKYAQCAEGLINMDIPVDRQTTKRLINGHMEYLNSMAKLVEGLSITIPKTASKKRGIQLWSDVELKQYVEDNFYRQDYIDAHYEIDEEEDEDDDDDNDEW